MKNSEILDRFFKLEKKYNLFESNTNGGIKWWDIVRYDVYIQILYLTVRKPAPKLTRIKNNRFNVFTLLYQDIKYLLKMRNRRVRNFFYTYPRGVDENGFSVDLISQDCLSIIKSQSFVVDGLQTGSTKECSYNNTALLIFKKLFKLTAKKNILNADINLILKNEFKIDFDFDKKINELLGNYNADRLYYNKLLHFYKPEIVFFLATGGEKGLIASAKHLDIKTAELQHGQTNRYHMYYSYPEGVVYNKNLTIPDTFLSFSEHWHTINYPVKNKISIGNSLFKNMNMNDTPRSGQSLLVISNGTFAPDLIPLIKSLATKLPDIPVVFKLHPQQKGHEREEAKQVFLGLPNVEIICTEKTTPELLNEASAVIAIQSTVVYEALQLGVKVFLYAKQDFESHDDIFINPNVYVIDEAKDIVDNVTRPFVKTDQGVFFKGFNKQKFIDFLNDSHSSSN
ncbi:hypothetical protein ESZ36_01465 [Colwellia demingiae]|uniref:UDP-N-acetylglucosamine 2-epimerase domain-containing protein n=1 Tax=Colwellia demingiae TaxID=89401 RepID=A0A5C6QSZ6_9GAMM|nr:hypothetical protein [Colwellia demingiae]TWX71927.1 hypothetical protein ESZ36_01465 [Colwellia demingiae]